MHKKPCEMQISQRLGCVDGPQVIKKNHHSLYTVNGLLNFSSRAGEMVQWAKGLLPSLTTEVCSRNPSGRRIGPIPASYLLTSTIVCVLTHACTHTHDVKITVKIKCKNIPKLLPLL